MLKLLRAFFTFKDGLLAMFWPACAPQARLTRKKLQLQMSAALLALPSSVSIASKCIQHGISHKQAEPQTISVRSYPGV